MPYLHMDSDTARVDLSRFWNLRIRLTDLLQELELQVDGMVSAVWQSPGAVSLGNDFHYTREILEYRVAELEELLRNLEREISAWEEMGNTFHRVYGDLPSPNYMPRYTEP